MKYGYHKIIFPFLFILITASLFFPFRLSSQQPFFRRIATIDDFGSGQIKCIYQDKQGFVWIGATSGAYRFDGQEFTILPVHDSILNRSITAIYEDSKNTLWFGFEDGNILKSDRFQVTAFKQKSELPQSKITAIVEDQGNNLWVGTYGEGLYVSQEDNFIQITAETGLSDDYIYTIVPDKNENVWTGTDNGISVCSIKDGHPSIRIISVNEGLPDFIVRSLKMDEDGKVWAGMDDKGISCYDPKQDKFEVITGMNTWNRGSVNDISKIGGLLWIAASASGLIEYNPASGNLKSLSSSEGLNINRINSMLNDYEGNTWLISNKEILLSFGNRLEFLNSFDGTEFTNIHAICCDDEDNLMFANDRGIHYYQKVGIEAEKKLISFSLNFLKDESKIMSLYRDIFGFIWIGTFGQGLIRLDPESGRHISISEKDGLLNGNVLSIKGTQNEIWFGTLGGAFRCKIDQRFAQLNYIPEFINYGQSEGLSNNYIYNIFIDKMNRVWFATDGSGVCYFENGKFVNIPSDSTFRDKIVYSVTVDENGVVWMNVAKEGIYKFDGKEMIRVYTDDQHKNLSFSGIIASNNELIISYSGGIDVLNHVTHELVHFEGNAGLSEPNSDPNTLAIDSKGAVWIGNEKGIVKYQPAGNPLWKQPQPRITDVNVYLEKANHITNNIFRHNQNHLSFSYAGLWYQYPEQVTYLIKLTGHDLDWIKTKNKNVIYSDLSPGDYTFEVKAALYGNFDHAEEASYSFTVKRPFWLTVWFLIIIIVLIGIGIYLYIKMRERRLEKREEILRERIRFQFENLKSQINPHFLFNSFSTLIALIDQNQEAAIEYVEELSNLFRTVLEYKDQDLITLREELSIINNYYNLQKKRYGDNLNLEIEKVIEEENIMVPPLTLQLLIENAIKHNIVSKDYPIRIRIFADFKDEFLFVENNLQPKNNEAKSTGIGIKNIVDRYHLLSEKKIQISKTESSFTVGLPFIYQKSYESTHH